MHEGLKIVQVSWIIFEHVQIVLAMTAIIVIVGGQNLGSSAKIVTMYFYMLIF